jgi:hypothetical protein
MPCAQAMELRLAGNAEARAGDLERAVHLYTQVLRVLRRRSTSSAVWLPAMPGLYSLGACLAPSRRAGQPPAVTARSACAGH